MAPEEPQSRVGDSLLEIRVNFTLAYFTHRSAALFFKNGPSSTRNFMDYLKVLVRIHNI